MATMMTACAHPSPTTQAMALARQHHEDEAITLLQKSLVTAPDDLSARRLLIRLLGVSGHLDEAKTQVDELTRRVPAGDPTPWIELGHAYELAHRYDDALAAYDTAAQAAPTSPIGPREGGMRAARWNEGEAALPRLEEAVKRGAHDEETFHLLGLLRLHAQDFDGAKAAYRAGLTADPHATECLLGLASVAVVQDDAASAVQMYTEVLAARPTYAPASLGRAWALGKLGRKDEARAEIDHAEQLGAPAKNVAALRAQLASPAEPPAP